MIAGITAGLWRALKRDFANDLKAGSRTASIGRDFADQPSILMKQVMAMSRHNASPRLGKLASIPTLVASADQDPIALPRFGQMLADLIPGSRLKLIKDASHGVTLEKPDETNQMLLDFLQKQ